MKIYVVIKLAKELSGEFATAGVEMAFKTEAEARAWLNGKKIVWEEVIEGFECTCERGVSETELGE